jgi:hypothetical protein
LDLRERVIDAGTAARRRADAGHRDGAGARGWASPWEWLFDPEAHLGLTHAP